MKIICLCDDWIDGMPQITAAQELSALHNVEYTAKPFMYCPWCGEMLLVEGSVTYSMKVLGKAIKNMREAIFVFYTDLLEITRNNHG